MESALAASALCEVTRKLKVRMATVKMNNGAVTAMLQSEDGPVGRDLIRRAQKVVAGAKTRCNVNTGRLRGSIRYTVSKNARGLVISVGTDVNYALYVHNGTMPHWIFPNEAEALWWPGADHPVPAVFHPGYKGNPFLLDALKEAR